MAYGFEKRLGKNDSDVQIYLEENMLFEAWTMIIRHWTGDWDDLYEQLERECYKKTTKLTDEEVESLIIEFDDYRRKAENEAWAKEWMEN